MNAGASEILFVHGALVRDGAWWWHLVADRVAQATGVRSRSVALPSCGESDAPAGSAGLTEDAEALRRALDDVDGDALVVGHSYGGTVAAQGADHPSARHLLYVSSYLPEVGATQGAIMSDEPDPVAVAPLGDGTLTVAGLDERSFAERFLQDVTDPALRARAWERVTGQGAGAFVTPTTRAAWRSRDSTYLVCTEDASTSVALQRTHAARAGRSVDLPTGHHPFLSRPDLVTREVVEVIRSLR